ncbi:Sporulation related domain-containing protein [Roseovarius litoreus]|uniref:Sporulation related domain-containing protein n=1 Tax=Roseovarius litoreus TaxID=1155722 RepID=A0A1M7FRM6_9RHOB|nr:Sporulation related domain-containing protein [Roseovarius litoreus]
MTAPAVVTAPAARREVVSSCPGLTGVSARYSTGEGVRCGPQTSAHVTYIEGGGGSGAKMRRVVVTQPYAARGSDLTVVPQVPVHAGSARVLAPVSRQVAVTGQTRVVPRHVYEQQVKSQGITVPHGYKKVWEDDRLNPYRAHQNFDGKANMEVIWSKTVPRVLIDTRTGRDVSFRFPGLRYPFTSFEQQRAAGVVVATQGRVVPDPIRVTRNGTVRSSAPDRQPLGMAEVRRSGESGTRAVISTRSQQPKAQAAQSGKRYVQAGMFGDHGNARAAAQRLANTGLPARMGRITRGGQTYTLVLAGPFGSAQELQAGLVRTRQAGFSDAFPR